MKFEIQTINWMVKEMIEDSGGMTVVKNGNEVINCWPAILKYWCHSNIIYTREDFND